MTNAIFVSKSIKIILALQSSVRTSRRGGGQHGRLPLHVAPQAATCRGSLPCCPPLLPLLPSSKCCEQTSQKLPLFRREFTEKILIHLVHLAIKRNLEIASARSKCNS